MITKSRVVYSSGPVRNVTKKKKEPTVETPEGSNSTFASKTVVTDSHPPPEAEPAAVEAGPEIGMVIDDVGVQAMMEMGVPLEHVDTAGTSGDSRKMKKEKKKHYVRSAAGQVWEDQTLTEWNPGEYLLVD